MNENLIKKATFFATIFAILSFCGMFSFAAGKEHVYVDKEKQEDNLTIQNIVFEDSKKKILMVESKTDDAHLLIPLTNAIKDTDIVIEDNYIESKLYITIRGLEKDYFTKQMLNSSGGFVKEAYVQYNSGYTKVELQLAGVYEHNVIVKNSKLYLDFTNPSELYDKIVVLDAGHGGTDTGIKEAGILEKDVALAILLETKVKLEEAGIKVYCTRVKDNEVEVADRIALANQSNADMFISIHAAEKVNQKLSGVMTVYNKDYFIPKFSSIELADQIERSVAQVCGVKALGLRAADSKNLVIQKITIPAAEIEVGCFSNEEERNLLTEKSFQDQIATAIVVAVEKSYQKMN